jgi:general secretion pathway protein H
MSTAMPSPVSQPEAGLGESGFSLVELMVVLFVLGLLATVAVLSIPGDSRVLRDEAERFAARTVAARDEAISGGRPVALVVSRAG